MPFDWPQFAPQDAQLQREPQVAEGLQWSGLVRTFVSILLVPFTYKQRKRMEKNGFLFVIASLAPEGKILKPEK
jgi:hypothetical protein